MNSSWQNDNTENDPLFESYWQTNFQDTDTFTSFSSSTVNTSSTIPSTPNVPSTPSTNKSAPITLVAPSPVIAITPPPRTPIVPPLSIPVVPVYSSSSVTHNHSATPMTNLYYPHTRVPQVTNNSSSANQLDVQQTKSSASPVQKDNQSTIFLQPSFSHSNKATTSASTRGTKRPHEDQPQEPEYEDDQAEQPKKRPKRNNPGKIPVEMILFLSYKHFKPAKTKTRNPLTPLAACYQYRERTALEYQQMLTVYKRREGEECIPVDRLSALKYPINSATLVPQTCLNRLHPDFYKKEFSVFIKFILKEFKPLEFNFSQPFSHVQPVTELDMVKFYIATKQKPPALQFKLLEMFKAYHKSKKKSKNDIFHDYGASELAVAAVLGYARKSAAYDILPNNYNNLILSSFNNELIIYMMIKLENELESCHVEYDIPFWSRIYALDATLMNMEEKLIAIRELFKEHRLPAPTEDQLYRPGRTKKLSKSTPTGAESENAQQFGTIIQPPFNQPNQNNNSRALSAIPVANILQQPINNSSHFAANSTTLIYSQPAANINEGPLQSIISPPIWQYTIPAPVFIHPQLASNKTNAMPPHFNQHSHPVTSISVFNQPQQLASNTNSSSFINDENLYPSTPFFTIASPISNNNTMNSDLVDQFLSDKPSFF